ncbi:condensation domain-containing protein, partial [Kitasatospora sp. NPDC001175]|uniref:condensation domain-containing protein n=1 Tax=Kitasatospora sp. NPDC001175 TaxID=3157103 RepID=UPI003D042563
ITRINTTLNTNLTIRDLFDNPTTTQLAHLTQNQNPHNRNRPALTTQTRPEHLPLSHAQQRLWILDQIEGPTPTYNIPLAIHLTGTLNTHALTQALNDLINHHEPLRTTYPQHNDQPYQHIHPTQPTHLTLTHIHTTPDQLTHHHTTHAAKPFNLSNELPIRATLFTTSPTTHTLLLTLHHIAADGWSLTPLTTDLTTAYTARLNNHTPKLTPLTTHYADYVLWHNQLLGNPEDPNSEHNRQLSYWTETLADLPEQLALPYDHPRPSTPSHQGDTVTFHITPQLHTHLTGLAHTTGASTFMVIQTAIATLLTRLGAGTDIPLGTAIAGRTDEATDNLIGFFVNTLVLRNNTTGDPSFRELLERTRNTDLTAYTNQDIPFNHLVETLNPHRTNALHPLFQVMLAHRSTAPENPQFDGLNTHIEPVHPGTAKFDLTFDLLEEHTPEGKPNGTHGHIEYSTDLFERSTVEGLAGRLVRLLEAATTEPDLPISKLEILSPEERELVIERWNDTTRDLPAATLPELFAARVA